MTRQDETTLPRITVACPFCGRLNRIRADRVMDRPRCGECGRPLLVDRPVKVTDADFDRVIGETDIPVLVDFYADWCGPCKVMAPVLDDFASDRAGSVLVGKLDTDREPETASRFGIRGIPTLIVFRDGAEVARRTGAIGATELAALADEAPA
ncbi:MAG TPA: thioredoxin TrxC [Gemmatimonadota bacterium]|nr:thioredoxin TrxC [Gemmatimonadota bacterium]